jgi:hypothetical protein
MPRRNVTAEFQALAGQLYYERERSPVYNSWINVSCLVSWLSVVKGSGGQYVLLIFYVLLDINAEDMHGYVTVALLCINSGLRFSGRTCGAFDT